MEHLNLEDWLVCSDGGVILYFDQAHTYIDRRSFLIMIYELICNEIELIDNEEG